MIPKAFKVFLFQLWKYNLQNYKTHQTLVQVQFRTLWPAGKCSPFACLSRDFLPPVASPTCQERHTPKRLHLPNFTYKVVPVARHVFGVQGDEII